VSTEVALVRIVQPEPHSGCGIVPAQGTRVFVGDQQVKGVTRVQLTAETNGIWRAQIDCTFTPSEMTAVAVIRRPGLLQRQRRRILHRLHRSAALARSGDTP
jgi:hypothetical protein